MVLFMAALFLASLWMLSLAWMRVSWTDEWLEVTRFFRKPRVLWRDIIDYRWRGAERCRLYTSGNMSFSLQLSLLGNYHELRCDLRAKLKPIRQQKARAALERGVLRIEKRILGIRVAWARWSGSTVEWSELLFRDSLCLSILRRAEVSVKYQYGIPEMEQLRLIDDTGTEHCLDLVAPDSDVLVEVLRQVSPPGIPWFDFSSMTLDDATNTSAKLTAIRAALEKVEKAVRGFPRTVLICLLLVAVPIGYGAYNQVVKDGGGVEEAIMRSARKWEWFVAPVFTVLLYQRWVQWRDERRLRGELARLEAAEAAGETAARRKNAPSQTD